MEKLIEQARQGNQEAFTELILLIQNDLYRIAKTRLNNDDDISDAIQETIIKAYKKLKKLKDNSKFKSWIIKILINECNLIYKKQKKQINICNKVEDDISLDIENDFMYGLNSRLNFELLINKLDYEERLIVTLFYNSLYSCNEISGILNLNINTVKSKLRRAKEKIKVYYKGGVLYE